MVSLESMYGTCNAMDEVVELFATEAAEEQGREDSGNPLSKLQLSEMPIPPSLSARPIRSVFIAKRFKTSFNANIERLMNCKSPPSAKG